MPFRTLLLALTLVVVSPLWGCGDDAAQLEQATVAIEYPADDGFVTTSRVTVRGSAEGVDQVVVNGKTAEVSGGKWTALVEFDQGPATATATAAGAEASVDFFVDSIAPALQLDSPARGVMRPDTEASTLTFAGSVGDGGSGVRLLKIGPAAIEPAADGSFSYDLELAPGYNEVRVEAVDEAGNRSDALRGAIWGPMGDPQAEVDQAFEFLVGPGALDVLTEVLEGLLTAEQVTAFVQDSFQHDNVTISAVRFDALDATITPRTADATHDRGWLEVVVTITNLQIEGDVRFSADAQAYPTTIVVDQAAVATELTVEASPAGGIVIGLADSTLDIADDALRFSIEGLAEDELTQDDVTWLRDIALTAARAAFSDLLGDQIIDQLYDPAMLRRQVEILGRMLEFQLLVRQVAINGQGVYVEAGVELLTQPYAGIPDAPGALALPLGERGDPGIGGDVLMTTHRITLDTILHGVWRSGLLSLQLDGDSFAGMELPAELRADALSVLLDRRIAELAGVETPARIDLRPLLPPVVAMEPTGDGSGLGLKLGELMMDLHLVPAAGEPIALATVALFVDVTVRAEIVDGRIALALDAAARADVDQEPALDLDDEKVEGFFTDMVALVVELIGDSLSIRGEAEVSYLRLVDPELAIHGAESDQLSAAIGVEAALDGQN